MQLALGIFIAKFFKDTFDRFVGGKGKKWEDLKATGTAAEAEADMEEEIENFALERCIKQSALSVRKNAKFRLNLLKESQFTAKIVLRSIRNISF